MQLPNLKGDPAVASWLVIAPWLCFVAFSCLFNFAYHDFPGITWTVFAVFVAMLLVYFNPNNAADNDTPLHLFLGPLSLLAVCFGTYVGYTTYDREMSHYWFLSDSHMYTNVVPNDPAAAYSDAGKLLFVDDARVDHAKAMGYQEDHLYCVAPIMDSSSIGSAVQYWAAGVDCCGARGDFTCDDAFNPDARGGAVIRETSKFREDLHDMYMKAVKQAEAAYEINGVEEPLFVRWVVDPEELQENYWRVGTGIILASGGVYAFLSVVFVGMAVSLTAGSSKDT